MTTYIFVTTLIIYRMYFIVWDFNICITYLLLNTVLWNLIVDCSTQWEIVIGSAELSNKMASYVMDQKVFVTNTLYSSCVSCVAECCVTIQVEVCFIGEQCDIQDTYTI
jgi:hypothetical protein